MLGVSIAQSAHVSARQHTSAYLLGSRVLGVSIAQSAYVSARQHTSAYLLGSRVLVLSIAQSPTRLALQVPPESLY